MLPLPWRTVSRRARQVEVFQQQRLDLAQPQAALPQQVERGAVEQRVAPLNGRAGLGDPLVEIGAQPGDLIVGEEAGEPVGLLQIGHAQQCLGHADLLLLQVEQERAEGAQLLVDGAGGAALGQPGIDVVEDVPALERVEGGGRVVDQQPAPEARVRAPEVAIFTARRAGRHCAWRRRWKRHIASISQSGRPAQ